MKENLLFYCEYLTLVEELALKRHLKELIIEGKTFSINRLQNDLSMGFTRGMKVKGYLIENKVIDEKGNILINIDQIENL